jgi:hypothetical protein
MQAQRVNPPSNDWPPIDKILAFIFVKEIAQQHKAGLCWD